MLICLKKGGWLTIALSLLFCICIAPTSTVDAKGEVKPEDRAKAVESAAKHNSKKSAIAIMKALMYENDGPVGFRMSDALRNLNSPDALEAVAEEIMKWTKPQQLMGAYWVFRGLAMQGNADADKVVRTAVLESKDKQIYLKAAALEAAAESARPEFADLFVETLKLWDKDWQKKNSVIALTLAAGAHRLVGNGNKEMLHKMVLGLADALEKTTDQRIQWYIVQSLSKMTGEDTYVTPGFWRFWVKSGGKKTKGEDDGPTSAGVNVPKFFKARAVGKRVVFVIDISGSMKYPVQLPREMKKKPKKVKKKKKDSISGETRAERKAREAREEEEKNKNPEIPKPDYSKVKSKLDLAKVELVHTLRHLPDDYMFNVVIYHTAHLMLIKGKKELVKASKGNKDMFIKKVEKLNWAALTNIHGALTRGYCVNSKKSLDPNKLGKLDPSWDPNCLNHGATTIFFLTDGAPTISDDCTDKGKVGRPNAAGQILNVGNGRYCQPGNIFMDVKRLNVFRKVVINTIGIGTHDTGLMSALAELTGGTYVDRSGR